ncbi:MAG: N-acetyl-gamma-glutamyl-phosphate reductase [Bacteroidetes bacterium HGW-Bacteroidetes-5]|jgi:N-acetyl-gamma-glutamyl-phosphate reductase|nr:MAG: N-acetyl-gamma-glutamyl-phosphate reductase [Bacteroidetes bacterium HGW-Bacteroidetes-5]
MIRVAIAGGTGYTAGELLRILLNHPMVEISAVLSSTLAGEMVSSVHKDLTGDTNLRFTSDLSSPQGRKEIDLIFLTLGHGLSKRYLDELNLPESCKIIDLGNDFRLDTHYKGEDFVYGLCELNREEIVKAKYIANPGCFATSILLALLPLAVDAKLNDDIHIHAITGSTGAGKSLSESTHFSYRDSNISVYKPFTHQHLGEIKRVLETISAKSLSSATQEHSAALGEIPNINFVPIRGDFTRGIFASIYTKITGDLTLEQVYSLYNSFYLGSPFVKISREPISMKEVVNTNKTLLHIESHNGYWHITSVIDNLLKGASGQAVQNMNLMFSIEESSALRLKGSAF